MKTTQSFADRVHHIIEKANKSNSWKKYNQRNTLFMIKTEDIRQSNSITHPELTDRHFICSYRLNVDIHM